MNSKMVTFPEESVLECPLCHTARGDSLAACQDDRFGYPGTFQVYQCRGCGLLFLGSRITQENVGSLYTRYYQTHSAPVGRRAWRGAPSLMSLVRWLYPDTLPVHRVRGFANVIEIGPGKRPIIDRFDWSGSRYGAVEFDEKAAKVLSLNPRVGTVFPDLASAAAEQGEQRYDACIADQVLEHVYDPVQFLKELARLVKPGGSILLGTPNADSRWRSAFAERWIGWHVPYHTMLFSRQSLAWLANASGVELARVETATPGSWLRLQHAVVGRRMSIGDVLRSAYNERVSPEGKWSGDNLCVEFRLPKFRALASTTYTEVDQGSIHKDGDKSISGLGAAKLQTAC